MMFVDDGLPTWRGLVRRGRRPRTHMSAPDAITAAANPEASRRGMRPLLKAVLALLVAGSTLASAQLYAGACAWCVVCAGAGGGGGRVAGQRMSLSPKPQGEG